ncbi:MAG: hypothetical protein M1818_001540 [Claussenomyces sp. TS43310]|nr:MAG: hypothetical protein M1818_001540 [Claussenomyces sp. TS43310]
MSATQDAGVGCVNAGAEKKRPISKLYVEALESQVADLELFVVKLAKASSSERDRMLAKFRETSSRDHFPDQIGHSKEIADDAMARRPRNGHLVRRKDGNSASFFGETSFLQINLSADEGIPEDHRVNIGPFDMFDPDSLSSIPGQFVNDLETQSINDMIPHTLLTPQSALCQNAMASFFRHQYVLHHMCLYREYFLRDYNAGGGPYYSDLLLYAICALGALASDDTSVQGLSDMFANRAQELLYNSALESPNLTTLQALLLLGHRDIGRGKRSKGWLFTGLAFRLVHEMGLHLDPNHWKTAHDSDVEREILRRVYWAAFVADTKLSLFFGRPPALHPGEADVNDTIRIAYPPGWDSLLDNYIKKNTTKTEYEDGITLVMAFIQQVELCKIVHRMLTEVFENRNSKVDASILTASAKSVHVALARWRSNLPSKLHWNIWSRGIVPPYVIHLHVFYHTVMIVLHRPPPHSSDEYLSASTSDLEICYHSLSSILQLFKLYSRYYSYNHLPSNFVHAAASAASIVLLKRYLESRAAAIGSTPSSGTDTATTAQQLDQVLTAIDNISLTWTSAHQIRTMVLEATNTTSDLHLALPDSAATATSLAFDWDLGPDWSPDMTLSDPSLLYFTDSAAISSGLLTLP